MTGQAMQVTVRGVHLAVDTLNVREGIGCPRLALVEKDKLGTRKG